MKVLVTGAAGFLGRAVVERLLAHGVQHIKCFVRPTSDTCILQQLQAINPQARIEYVTGNLLNCRAVQRALEGVDSVYHLAAGMAGVPASMFANTVVASQRLLDAMQQRGRRIVLVSSVGVYGTSSLSTKEPISENAQLETYPEKRSVYFHCKIWQEQLFREYARQGYVDLVVIRPGVLYGPDNPRAGLPSRLGIALGDLFFVLGRGRLPLSYVDNCAEAVVLAGLSRNSAGETYNVVDDDLPVCDEYLRVYKDEVKRLKTIRLPFRLAVWLSWAVSKYHLMSRGQIPAVLSPYETRSTWRGHQFSNRKIKELGWRQVLSTEVAMRQTFADLRCNSESMKWLRNSNWGEKNAAETLARDVTQIVPGKNASPAQARP